MKKSFFFLAAGAVALSACTSEEVLQEGGVNNNVISFENAVAKQTRTDVTDLTLGNLKHFNVYGYYVAPGDEEGTFKDADALSVFENINVDLDENDMLWKYTGGDRFWAPGGKYYFYAYSCGGSILDQSKYGTFTADLTQPNYEARQLQINNYVCNEDHQHDLLFASKEGIVGQKKGYNEPVSLKFKHLLTKISATFTSEFPEGYELVISNVQLNNLRNVGSYNPSKDWFGVNRDDSKSMIAYLLCPTDVPVTTMVGKDAAVSHSAYVLPYSYTEDENKVNISFNLKVRKTAADGNVDQILNCEISGMWLPTWNPGMHYNYNVKISGNTANLDIITFVVKNDIGGDPIADWDDVTDQDVLNLQVSAK